MVQCSRSPTTAAPDRMMAGTGMLLIACDMARNQPHLFQGAARATEDPRRGGYPSRLIRIDSPPQRHAKEPRPQLNRAAQYPQRFEAIVEPVVRDADDKLCRGERARLRESGQARKSSKQIDAAICMPCSSTTPPPVRSASSPLSDYGRQELTGIGMRVSSLPRLAPSMMRLSVKRSGAAPLGSNETVCRS
jgi:hypothetical protein